MTELEPAHQRALRKSGIETSFRLYDLRHTYGTRAIEAGIDVFSVAKLMGHADLDTTQRYVHLSKGLSFAKTPHYPESLSRNNVTGGRACYSFQTHFEFWRGTGNSRSVR